MDGADRFKGPIGKEISGREDGETAAFLIVAAVDQQKFGLVVAIEQFAAAHGDAVAVDRGRDQVSAAQCLGSEGQGLSFIITFTL